MRKALFSGMLFSLAVALGACSDDNAQQVPNENDSQAVKLSASMEGFNPTRTVVTDLGEFFWIPGDQIAVYSADGNFYDFTYTGYEPAASGDFSGSYLAKPTTYAISPASVLVDRADWMDNTLTISLNNQKVWEPNKTDAPMMAEFPLGSKNMLFKHLGGVLKVYLTNVPTDKDFRLTVTTDNQKITGSFKVQEDTEGHKVIATSSGSNENQVQVDLFSNSAEKCGFYIPMPVGNYQNVEVSFVDSEGNVWFDKSIQTLDMKRNQMVIMPTLACGISADSQQETIAPSADKVVEDINSILQGAAQEVENTSEPADVNITVAASQTDGGVQQEPVQKVMVCEEVVIPSGITNQDNASVKLTFDAVPQASESTSDNIIVITDNSEMSESRESKSNVQIAIPDANLVENAEAPSLNIALPSSTVTLSAVGETATYETVTALTANNTLRVATGVTIRKVIVRGGNILIDGGTVDYIENTTGQAVVVVVKNGTLNGTDYLDATIVLDAPAIDFCNEATADGIDTPYIISSYAELKTLATRVNSGDKNRNNIPYRRCNYRLAADIDCGTVSDWVPIGLNYDAAFTGTFDGCGHTISGDFTISNHVEFAGLFGRISRATIQNLTLHGSVTKLAEPYTYNRVGGVACYVAENSLIMNCFNHASIRVMDLMPEEHNYGSLAGIAGDISDSKIIACVNYGTLIDHDNYQIGGITPYTVNSCLAFCADISGVGVINSSISSTGLLQSCWSGSTPSISEIEEMNNAGRAYGWKFDSNGLPVKDTVTGLPDNPVIKW